ncbi:Cys-tRNA(Pro) deacylase [Bacillus sp. Marseille-P3661]|uniref:Cys-tRNA(Pro) deacylase n=1 Tax=Bacillus sp. Marseille-P3661 TaxID=1936234 RepID=UPI000C852D6D|nr:Cys-tRNA(Pro) deacylase [Bacillus sp. Marseille-P3661]
MASKTNAMRILDKQKIDYNILTYDASDGMVSGIDVAVKINRPHDMVYKTLVAYRDQNIYVFVIPVAKELDLKKAAKAAMEKKLEMLPVKDIQKWTGYIRGGCSPVGMKKNYPTYIDNSAIGLEKMIVSAGKIGTQLELKPHELIKTVQGQLLELIK